MERERERERGAAMMAHAARQDGIWELGAKKGHTTASRRVGLAQGVWPREHQHTSSGSMLHTVATALLPSLPPHTYSLPANDTTPAPALASGSCRCCRRTHWLVLVW